MSTVPSAAPALGEATASSPSSPRAPSQPDPSLLTLAADCSTTAASVLISSAALASLTTDLVARNKDWLQQATTQVASSRSALLARKTRVLGSSKHQSRKQCKKTIVSFDTVNVSVEQLRVWAAVAATAQFDLLLDDVVDIALAASPLLSMLRQPPQLAPVIGVGNDIALIFAGELGCLATGDGLCVLSAAGPGLECFKLHSRNEFSVVLAQADGSVPVWLVASDVAVSAFATGGDALACTAESTAAVPVGGRGAVSVLYGGLHDEAPDVVLQLTVCGVAVADAATGRDWSVTVVPWPLAGHACAAVGTHVSTVAVAEGEKHGLAVSTDENWLVVGLIDEGTLSVYSLPGGELVRTFGGEGDGPLQFDRLRRLCFAPNGNLIVVDFGNKRLQEVTLEGVFVRSVGVGEFCEVEPYCVDVAGDAIAVGCVVNGMPLLHVAGGPDSLVVLFDFSTGAVTSRFGAVGYKLGELSALCTGIRFSPDGSHLIVAEGQFRRLSLFTSAGVFMRRLGVGVLGLGVKDVLVSAAGEFIVADPFSSRVCVLSQDGSELVRSWGGAWIGPTGRGQLQDPTTLAAAGQHLYVMEDVIGKVHVFD